MQYAVAHLAYGLEARLEREGPAEPLGRCRQREELEIGRGHDERVRVALVDDAGPRQRLDAHADQRARENGRVENLIQISGESLSAFARGFSETSPGRRRNQEPGGEEGSDRKGSP